MTTGKPASDVLQESCSALLLENQLCFALYAATRAITRTFRDEFEPLGLTYPQYLVLIVLWEDNDLTVSQLGRRLMLDLGTLTPLLKRLEGMGLITRIRSQIDEREVRIGLTDEGGGLRGAVAEARQRIICRLNMSESEVQSLRSSVMDLISRLERPAQDVR